MKQSGTHFVDIVNQLDLDLSTVHQNYKQVHKTRNFYAKASRPGRPRLLSPRALRRAEREITLSLVCDGADV
jgi:hypothetical protein